MPKGAAIIVSAFAGLALLYNGDAIDNAMEANDGMSVQCMGYVKVPCNERAFSACAVDVGRAVGCERTACGMEIWPAIYYTCACDSLVNPSDRQREKRRTETPSAAQFKLQWQESKEQSRESAARQSTPRNAHALLRMRYARNVTGVKTVALHTGKRSPPV